MGALTDRVPKPLLKVGGRTMIERHLLALAQAGCRDVVVNVAHLGAVISDTLGDGAAFGVRIRYSDEGDEPLETAGGVVKALPLLGDQPFVLLSADTITDYPLPPAVPASGFLARLVLVPNPAHHPQGDFGLKEGRLTPGKGHRFTYSGIGVYRPQMFADLKPGRRPLRAVLAAAVRLGLVEGELYRGAWFDAGTPQRLTEASAWAAAGFS